MNTQRQTAKQSMKKGFVFVFISLLLLTALVFIFRDALFDSFQTKCVFCDSTGVCAICESSGLCKTCGGGQSEQCSDCDGTGICSECNGSGLCRICGIN